MLQVGKGTPYICVFGSRGVQATVADIIEYALGCEQCGFATVVTFRDGINLFESQEPGMQLCLSETVNIVFP